MKKIIMLICCFLLISGLTGCGKTEEMSALEQIKSDGKLVLGTSADWPPFEFHKVDGNKDEIVGFDIEIGKEIAKELGVELVIEDMSFDGLLPALVKGKIDIIISGMSPTEKRKEKIDFSNVYYNGTQTALIHTKDLEKLKTIADLKGKRVGVQKASLQEEIAKSQIENPELEALSTIPDLILQLETNKVDIVVCETPVAEAYANSDEELSVAPFTFESTSNGTAIGINKGREDLVEVINTVLERLKKEGKMEELFIKSMELSQEK